MTRNNVVYAAKNKGVIGNAEILCDGITVLVGPNGCGKSTILKRVCCPEWEFEYMGIVPVWRYNAWLDGSPLEILHSTFEANRETFKVSALESPVREAAIRIDELLGGYFDYDASEDNLYFVPRKAGERRYAEYCSDGELALGWLQAGLFFDCWEDGALVVADSPDAYLSPDWIVEYSRLIVWINKALGTRFVISTHNPDMVSAIRYISEAEETLDAVRFYLAKKNDDGLYDYRECVEDKKSIEPIFKFFAIALDKISEYSCEKVKEEGGNDVNVV